MKTIARVFKLFFAILAVSVIGSTASLAESGIYAGGPVISYKK